MSKSGVKYVKEIHNWTLKKKSICCHLEENVVGDSRTITERHHKLNANVVKQHEQSFFFCSKKKKTRKCEIIYNKTS